ncbi:zinc-ribbon domain-containing protein [Dactylosporangium sp. CA-233914]|uniref:zinc-ribbon domain-containing protein n=1 Tax=Dactylosporangium sp. CA-233914 TaxID=3239934 RepID=UPI003D93A7CC
MPEVLAERQRDLSADRRRPTKGCHDEWQALLWQMVQHRDRGNGACFGVESSVDRIGYPAVMAGIRVPRRRGRPRTRPGRILGDKAYSINAIRADLRRRRIAATIPERADQQANRRKHGAAGGRPPAFDAERYKERNTVERAVSKTQTVPSRGHALRQACLHVPGHHRRRNHQNLAPRPHHQRSKRHGLDVTEQNGIPTPHPATGGTDDRLCRTGPHPGDIHEPELSRSTTSTLTAVNELAAKGVMRTRYDGLEQDERGVFRVERPDSVTPQRRSGIKLGDFPELTQEWDHQTNGMAADTVPFRSRTKFWWVCRTCEYRWQASPDNRAGGGRGCPRCANRVVDSTNCMATTHPDLTEEWHPTLNTITPQDVVAGSNRKAWWLCRRCDEAWEATIASRALNGNGCRHCKGWAISQAKQVPAHGRSLSDPDPWIGIQHGVA